MKIYVIDEQGNRIEAKIKWGPSHSGGLRLGPNIRRLPRIKLRRAGDDWEAKWVAQNDSFLAEQHVSRVGAIRAVIATARAQRWPLFAPSDPSGFPGRHHARERRNRVSDAEPIDRRHPDYADDPWVPWSRHARPIVDQPCIASGRPDHRHAWKFDGDDPYVLCDYCGERRDALTGRSIRPPERKHSNVAGAFAVLRRAAEEVPDEAVRETRKIALRVIEKELQLLEAQRDAYIGRLDEEVKTI